MNSEKIFIAVAGNIGTGKTTLSQMLSQRLGWVAHFEAVAHNPYLSDFYADMNRWSFPLQIYFLNHRFQAHQSIVSGESSSIQDRSIYEDAHIFARNLFEQGWMEKRDYENYLQIYKTLTSLLTPPDLVVYLRKSVPELRRRIEQRGRDFEKNIPIDYLTHLNRYYDDWVEGYTEGKKIIIESDSLDFVQKPEDFEMILSRVLSQIDQKDFFLTSP